ncbi:hypothetical protein ACGFX4_09730 [Kitasatospora sp. NPDC048365]|uniref:DUF7144 family membrane protein n=1 Tax=Kitasatospora sp. NPDC048365 TaxID=3364050 RepID=UPI00372190C8
MSEQTTQPPGASRPVATPPPRARRAPLTGGVVFAAVLLLCNGILAVLQGIAAVAEDDVYARIGRYVYEFDLTGWGWIHIVLGVLVAVAGWGLFQRHAWAAYGGMFFAALSLISQFLFLPYSPVWSVVVIAIDVFVIWALAGSLFTED